MAVWEDQSIEGGPEVRGGADSGSPGDRVDQMTPAVLRVKYADLMSTKSQTSVGRRVKVASDFLQLLQDNGFGHLQIRLERSMPNSADTASVVLLGGGHKSLFGRRRPAVAVVELRDWRTVTRVGAELERVVAPELTHSTGLRNPAVVAAWNADRIKNYLPAPGHGHDSVECRGFAYLPQARSGVGRQTTVDESLVDPTPAAIASSGVAERADYNFFTGTSKDRLLALLLDLFTAEDEGSAGGETPRSLEAGRWFDSAEPRPTVRLMGQVATAVRGQSVFRLTTEQKRVTKEVSRDLQKDAGEVLVVLGGPGTGKSAIALELVSQFVKSGRVVKYATPSSAFRKSLESEIGRGRRTLKDMFVSTRSFRGYDGEPVDVLLVDEAHRMGENSAGLFDTKEVAANLDPQVEELIRNARVSVFFIDPEQQVRPQDAGSLESIQQTCARLGRTGPTVLNLTQKFRTGGSLYADSWIRGLLGYRDATVRQWEPDRARNFTVQVASSITEFERLHHVAAERCEKGQARMVAGYCWPWSSLDEHGAIPRDIVVRDGSGTLEKAWNLGGDKLHVQTAEGVFPGRAVWAIDPRGADLVGCVYTAQGFEFSSVAVLLGPDFVRRGRRWIARPCASKDRAIRGLHGAEGSRLLRNTYRVLMTRGVDELIMYSVDEETNRYLRSLV